MLELFVTTGAMFGMPAVFSAVAGISWGQKNERLSPVLGAILGTAAGLTLWSLGLSLLSGLSVEVTPAAWAKGLFALAQLSCGASVAAGLGTKIGEAYDSARFGGAAGAFLGATSVASFLLWMAATLR